MNEPSDDCHTARNLRKLEFFFANLILVSTAVGWLEQ